MTTIAHHPSGHPYVDNLWGPQLGQAPRPSVWDPGELASAGVRLVHLHFGFELRTARDLAAWVAELHDRGVAVVHTVHDLDNPHLVEQAGFHRAVDEIVRRADAVTTLTPVAAAAVARRTGRVPVVIPHPHVVPLDTMCDLRCRRRSRHGIYVHAGAGRPNLDLDAIGRLSAARGDRPVLVHIRPSAPPTTMAVLQRLARPGRLRLDVRARLTDAELWDRLAAAELVFLAYRWGTHSGLLEAAHDVGTPVLAPPWGGYGDQGAHTYGDDLAADVERAIAGRPAVTVAMRRRDRRRTRALFAAVHRDALAAVRVVTERPSERASLRASEAVVNVERGHRQESSSGQWCTCAGGTTSHDVRVHQ